MTIEILFHGEVDDPVAESKRLKLLKYNINVLPFLSKEVRIQRCDSGFLIRL